MLVTQMTRFQVTSAVSSPSTPSTPRQRTSESGSTPAEVKFQLLHPDVAQTRPAREIAQSGGVVDG